MEAQKGEFHFIICLWYDVNILQPVSNPYISEERSSHTIRALLW